MITETWVTFDRTEKRLFSTVMASLGVGFPEMPYPESDHRAGLVKALNRLAQDGTGLDHSALSRASEALQVQIEQCAAEADEAFWLNHLPVGAPGGGLIADPDQMRNVLVQARGQQLADARAALDLVTEALSRVSPPRRHWRDMEEDEDP